MTAVAYSYESAPREVLMLLFTSILFDGRVQKEATTLRDLGYRVTIAFVPDSASELTLPDRRKSWSSLSEHLEDIALVPLEMRTKSLRNVPRPLRRVLQALEIAALFSPHVIRKRWAAIHSHELAPAVFALLGKMFRRSKVVYDSHELEVASSDEKAKRLWLLYEKLVLRFSDVIITVNEHIADLLSERSGKKVLVVANRPAHVSADRLRSGAVRSQLKLLDENRLLMYVGNLSPWARGVEVVVETLSKLPPSVHFAIVGVGRVAEFRRHLESLQIWTPEIRDRVHFLDPVPPDDVPVILSDADISVMLYRSGGANEAFNSPNKLFQSILAGVPILASRNETFPPIVENGPHGPIGAVCDPRDVGAAASSILALLDPRAAASCRVAAGKLATEVSWHASGVELAAAYRTLRDGP